MTNPSINAIESQKVIGANEKWEIQTSEREFEDNSFNTEIKFLRSSARSPSPHQNKSVKFNLTISIIG